MQNFAGDEARRHHGHRPRASTAHSSRLLSVPAVGGKCLKTASRPSAELAKAEKVNDSYLSRILRLTLIAPEMTETILAGRQPSTLQLDDLLKPLPSAWAAFSAA